MTCIVGLIDGKKVWMGGDSAAVDVDQFTITTMKQPKVFKVGQFIFGATSSSIKLLELLRYRFKPPKHPPKTETHKYMATLFVDAMKLCFNATKKEDDDGFDGQILVGYRGRLFIVFSDFSVLETPSEFASIGCGEYHADGCMAGSAETSLTPQERILKALQAAEHFSAGVRGPFTIDKV